MSSVWIGTSGWMYDGWRGDFYPPDVPKRHWLEWYAGRFSTTEVNGSFYRTPSPEAVRAWREQTPHGFLFAWKASRFITHWKRLGPASASSLELMESRLRILGDQRGPVLFQLPARFRADRQRLASFCQLLAPRRQYAFEFRHESWYEPVILDLLRDRNIALCLSDHRDAPAPWEVTAEYVYVRGHGPTGEYRDRYPPRTLAAWARSIRAWRRKRLDVYCYFDNDQKAAAPHDAAALSERVRSRSPSKRKNREPSRRIPSSVS